MSVFGGNPDHCIGCNLPPASVSRPAVGVEVPCELCGNTAYTPTWWSPYSPYADHLRAIGRPEDAARGRWVSQAHVAGKPGAN